MLHRPPLSLSQIDTGSACNYEAPHKSHPASIQAYLEEVDQYKAFLICKEPGVSCDKALTNGEQKNLGDNNAMSKV